MQQQKSFQTSDKGTLFLVPTPIGNLEDMTIRALNTLKMVDLIASEDTRHTQKLLNHFGIDKPQISCHEHNIMERIPQLLEKLEEGVNIAQVSDAGMPSISDPGHELVKACIGSGISVVALPGPNAALTALIASGLAPQPFYFYGFLKRKKQEQVEELRLLQGRPESLIFYESPHRLQATVENMATVFDPGRQMVVCRELTKRFEEYTRGTIAEIRDFLRETSLKGEICLMVAGATPQEIEEVRAEKKDSLPLDLSLKEQVEWVMTTKEMTSKEAIKFVAKALNYQKQEVYKAYHKE